MNKYKQIIAKPSKNNAKSNNSHYCKLLHKSQPASVSLFAQSDNFYPTQSDDFSGDSITKKLFIKSNPSIHFAPQGCAKHQRTNGVVLSHLTDRLIHLLKRINLYIFLKIRLFLKSFEHFRYASPLGE